MANTYVDYTAVASQTDYNFSFEYLRDDHVKVKVNDVIVTNYTIVTSPTPTKIRFNTAPAAGAEIRIYRDSRGDFSPLVDFVDGSVLTENELDEAYKHNLFVSQEASEGTGNELLNKKGGANYDAEGNKIINLGTPGASTDAANKGYVDQTIDNSIALGGSPAIVSLGGYDVTSTNTTLKQLRAWTADIETNASDISTANINVTSTGSTTARSLADRFADSVNILDYIPSDKHAGIVAGTNTDDLSSYFEDAIETSKRVFIPKGNYHLNANINSKTILEGEGSKSTILRPYNESGAVFVYTFAAMQTPVYDFWDYHSEVSNIGFTTKTTSLLGIGFAFGTVSGETYTADAEYANNVKFKGCQFEQLNKGVAFNHGNIGSEFYSCGFSGNKYGVYMLDSKDSSTLMHAGCKYFYAGEMSSNECAVYVHNETDGYGALSFKDVIFEYNKISCYIYNSTRTFVPPVWDGCWFEGNGLFTSGSTTVTIDSWSGATRSDQTLDARNLYIDGKNSKFVFRNSFFTDCKLSGTDQYVTVDNCRVENETGYLGRPSEVVDSRSTIEYINPNTNGGVDKSDNIITTGMPNIQDNQIGSSIFLSNSRWFNVAPRSSKLSSYGASLVTGISFETQVDLGGGSFTLAGSVVSDGRIYSNCNQYTRASFGSSEYVRVNSPSSVVTTTAGFYVFSFDFKRTQGNPSAYIWNRGTIKFIGQMTAPTLNRWYTFAGLGYSPGGQQIYLDFNGSNEDCTWLASAYQLHRFDTISEAQAFFKSGTYAES